MNKHQVYNLIVLDESGSMQSIKNATISGFNEVVQTIKGAGQNFPEQEHFVSLITFNGLGIKTLLDKQPVTSLNELNANSYKPDASTPLYDAIGKGINGLINYLPAQNGQYNVLVTILTDGEENASREFSGAQIKQLIDQLKEQGWTFTYIGANHDVEKAAASLSIDNTLAFLANPFEMQMMFSKEKKARALYYQKIRDKEDLKKGYFDDEEDAKN
ncbi:MAG TPA: VWA domain-containing protein [Chitinophagales bacterium]|nr:VWA domain-containing protein [Chitinophagales bacterium]